MVDAGSRIRPRRAECTNALSERLLTLLLLFPAVTTEVTVEDEAALDADKLPVTGNAAQGAAASGSGAGKDRIRVGRELRMRSETKKPMKPAQSQDVTSAACAHLIHTVAPSEPRRDLERRPHTGKIGLPDPATAEHRKGDTR